MRELFRDRLVVTGLVLVVLTAALIAFIASSSLPTASPLLGVVTYSLLPVFFVAGAIVFYLAIHRESRSAKEDARRQ